MRIPCAPAVDELKLQIVKRFLDYASGRKIEEVQAFTAMHVPHPSTYISLPVRRFLAHG